jgi:ankyrin repeat protein
MMIYHSILIVMMNCLIFLSAPVYGQTIDDARAAVRVRDYESAVDIYGILARSGDLEAAYQLACMYRAGRGVEQNLEVAGEWMLQAARAGDARAQYSMGQLMLAVDEGHNGREEARAWYEKAAIQGHDMAAISLQALDRSLGPAVAGMNAQQRQEALCQAARQGDLEIVRSLLRTYPDEIATGDRERTALAEAILGGHADIVALFLQHGDDPNGVNGADASLDRVIPLHAAVRLEKTTILTMLLAAGADVERRDEAGNTALIIASSTGSIDMVLALLAGGASVESTDDRGWTALTAARQKNHLRIEQILLEHKALDPLTSSARRRTGEFDLAATAEGEAGWTPLMYAAWRGDVDAVRRILRKPQNVDEADLDGHTALSRAAWRGQVDIVNVLLAAGADPNTRQNNGFTPLLWATQNGHIETIRSLVGAHASLDAVIPATGYSAMLLACSHQDAVTAGLLLALGADINWRSPGGETALMVAAAGESSVLLRQLLDDGANLEMSDDRGRTAIWHAINSGRHQNLSLLLDRGANREARDDSNQHPFIEAVRKADSVAVQILLQHGVQPDVQSGSGNSALIVAATTGSVDTMRILIEAGANLDIRNQQGQSALMRAAISDQQDAVVLLLEAGADTRLVDGDHKTARDLAKLTEHLEILELLKQNRSR